MLETSLIDLLCLWFFVMNKINCKTFTMQSTKCQLILRYELAFFFLAFILGLSLDRVDGSVCVIIDCVLIHRCVKGVYMIESCGKWLMLDLTFLLFCSILVVDFWFNSLDFRWVIFSVLIMPMLYIKSVDCIFYLSYTDFVSIFLIARFC